MMKITSTPAEKYVMCTVHSTEGPSFSSPYT